MMCFYNPCHPIHTDEYSVCICYTLTISTSTTSTVTIAETTNAQSAALTDRLA